MTGLVEQLSGASFSPGNIILPTLPTLPAGATTALWSYLGTDLAHSQNLMPGAPATTQLGSPTYQPAYLSGLIGGSPQIALDTNVLDDVFITGVPRHFSVLFVARHTGALDAQASIPMNNQDASTLFGIGISLIGTTGFGCGINGPGINMSLPVTGITSWKIYCAAYNDSSPRTLWLFNLTDGTQVSGTNVDAARASGNGHMLIGASPRTNVGTRTCDVAFAGWIKGQVLTYTLAQQYAANIRANLILRGLTGP